MKSIFFIFEFGVPNYREFILENLYSNQKYQISGISADDKFNYHNPQYKIQKAIRLINKGDNKVYIFSPVKLLQSDVVITTFNLRRPHTWMYVLFFPWKKWVFWGQGFWKGKSIIVNFLRKLLLRLSSGYIVYTEEGKRNLIKFGYPAEKISVAVNTLEVTNSTECKGEKYLLYIGRVQERKRLEWIFPTLSKLNIKIRIVGDGDYKDRLIMLAKKYNVDRYVDFYPATFNEDEIKAHFLEALCYVSPGHVGLGVVHAFSYGCPVLTVKSMRHAPEFSYCNHHNSYLVESKEKLGEAILSVQQDFSLLHTKKKAAYQFYRESLSTKNVITAFEKQIQGSKDKI